MHRDSPLPPANNSGQQTEDWLSMSSQVPDIMSFSSSPLSSGDYQILDAIQRRVLWLSTLIVHHANHSRPSSDDLKVGGHQASSASMVSILTALYFHYLDAGDRVSIKPHASPAYHAVQYLLGNLDRKYLQTLRAFGGLQAYPSRVKDPDPVDFSTGSVGLGAVAPDFAAAAHRYALQHFGHVTSKRFIAVVGDAELDEGSVWEAAIEESLQGLGNVLLIVDLNRQSLDRVVPGIRAMQLKRLFHTAGWQVLETKYGQLLQQLFGRPGGAALRRRIDEMSNEEYQSLLRRRGADLRTRLTHPGGMHAPEDREIAQVLQETPDEHLHEVLSNLGGHDLNSLLATFSLADRRREGPTVIFAYTIKGWGLPFAGDPLNHSMLLSAEQVEALQRSLGIAPGTEWDAFAPDSAEGRWCRHAAQRLRREQEHRAPLVEPQAIPATLDLSYPNKLSTQEALGRVLPKLADVPQFGPRLVSTAPDVSVSTHLSTWISKEGRDLVPDAAPGDIVQIATTGAMVPEAVEAAHRLARESVAANVLCLTSPKKLFSLFTERQQRLRHDALAQFPPGPLETLLPAHERNVPIVSVQDASAHSLAFLGGISGIPLVPLGVDRFGQSGSQAEVYLYAGISVEDIVSAGYLALDLREERELHR